MIKPNFKEQLIVFGEASKLIEVSDFLRQNWVRSNVLIFDKKTINSLELENLELLENQSSVIYIEEEYKSDFDPLKDGISPHLYSPPLKNRLKNSLNYYTSIFNILYLLKRKFILKRKIPSPFREDIFANTIFQSK